MQADNQIDTKIYNKLWIDYCLADWFIKDLMSCRNGGSYIEALNALIYNRQLVHKNSAVNTLSEGNQVSKILPKIGKTHRVWPLGISVVTLEDFLWTIFVCTYLNHFSSPSISLPCNNSKHGLLSFPWHRQIWNRFSFPLLNFSLFYLFGQ